MRIRFEVFVGEQGVPAELEPDEYDAEALHLPVKEVLRAATAAAHREYG